MKNEDSSAYPQKIEHWNGSVEFRTGLTKLEAFVMHNMPKLEPVELHKTDTEWFTELTSREVAQIQKTIEACRYALAALEKADE